MVVFPSSETIFQAVTQNLKASGAKFNAEGLRTSLLKPAKISFPTFDVGTTNFLQSISQQFGLGGKAGTLKNITQGQLEFLTRPKIQNEIAE